MSVLILMYHGVERRSGPLFADPDLFAGQLDAIVASRLPVLTVGEIGEALAASDEPALALTFDDGFASVVETAAPLLVERDLRATVFCVAGRLGGSNAWPTARPGAAAVELASAGALAGLVEAGFEIGGHGMEHAPLDTADPAEIRREVAEGRVALEQAVGVQVRSFAYPYGAGPSAAAHRAVSESYDAACTTRIGWAGRGSDLLALPRVDAHYLRSPERFAAVLGNRSAAYLVLRRLAAGARRKLRADYARDPGGR